MKPRVWLFLCVLLGVAACGDRPETADDAPAATPPVDAPADVPAESLDVAVAGLEGAEVKAFLDALRQAVEDDDRARVAAMVSYPLTVTLDGAATTFDEADALLVRYEEVFEPSIRQALRQQRLDALFANYQGVRIGQGELWIAGVYPEEDADDYELKIIAINHRADAAPR